MTHKKIINDANDRFKQELLLSKETARALKIKDAEGSKLYMLPKVRKIDNPDGLAVSSIGYHSTNISKFVGYHLQPKVKNIPSY